MFLKVVFLVSLLQFGKTQNWCGCDKEIRALKGDIQDEVRRAAENKATKENVRQRAEEVINTLAASQEEIKNSVEQCMTRDEVQEMIYNETQSIHAQITSVAQTVETVQTEILSLLRFVHKLYTCDGTPGWKQVVFINMTDTSYNCPPGLTMTSYSKRTCGRSNSGAGCSSTSFSVEGFEYSRVCGRIRGYQQGSTDAFGGAGGQTIDGYYIDGVSLTHGHAGGRQHIWTFASGISDDESIVYSRCPCSGIGKQFSPPKFVGNNYFCESGAHIPWSGWHGRFFPDDPLWDGQNCPSSSTCCQFNIPPWFTKTLPKHTTDDIELRICGTESSSREDTPLDIIELYVQ